MAYCQEITNDKGDIETVKFYFYRILFVSKNCMDTHITAHRGQKEDRIDILIAQQDSENEAFSSLACFVFFLIFFFVFFFFLL